MHTIKIRIALSLGVLALVAAAAGPAQAMPAGSVHKTVKTRTSKTAVRGGPKGGRAVSVPGVGVSYVTAGSTGDGAADDDECDSWAGAINETMSELREDSATDSGDVHEDIENIEHLTDGAMDRGCFIVY
jgi:hypothetical protein